MKKIRYIGYILLVLLIIAFFGYRSGFFDTKVSRNNTYDETYQLLYFYIDTCPNCNAFEEKVLPLIEAEFGSSLEITKYSLDDRNTKEIYDGILERLIDYDVEEDYGYGPFIVLDGYFAKLGMDSTYGEEFVDDLIRAVEGKRLGRKLSKSRYYFIDGNSKESIVDKILR